MVEGCCVGNPQLKHEAFNPQALALRAGSHEHQVVLAQQSNPHQFRVSRVLKISTLGLENQCLKSRA